MMNQQMNDAYVRIVSSLDDSDRDSAWEFLQQYSDSVDNDPELGAILRERVYTATGEWLE